MKSALGIAVVAGAYEDIKGFIEGGKKTLLGKITGVGDKGLPEFKKRNNDRVSHLPDFVQKLLGFKAPDYALQRIQNLPSVNNDSSKTISISTGNVTINTQATNGQDVKSAFVDNLVNQQYQSNSYFDDVVAR